jgi:hypothetical protein
MYLQLLTQYARYFKGRRAVNLAIFRPAGSRDDALARFRAALGLAGPPRGDEAVRFEVPGLPTVEGVVDFVSPSIIGVRTDDALLRFLWSPQGVVFAGHHLYGDADKAAATEAWAGWLDRTFA